MKFEAMAERHQKLIDGLEDFKVKELQLIELKKSRELQRWEMLFKRKDVQRPALKKSEKLLIRPKQVRYQVNTGSCSLNLGTLQMNSLIGTKSPQTTPRRYS